MGAYYVLSTVVSPSCVFTPHHPGFPGGSVVKKKEKKNKTLSANAGDVRYQGSIPGSRRSPRGGNGTPFQYSCLDNPMDRGTYWAMSPRGLKELDTTEQLTLFHFPNP